MNQSPYTPPRIPPEDQSNGQPPKKASWLRRVAHSIIDIIVIAASPLILIVWGFGLLYGWQSNNPLTFHLIYVTLILTPAIGVFVFAFTGRSPASPDNFSNIARCVGTIGCCLIGIILLSLYLISVFSWHGLLVWD